MRSRGPLEPNARASEFHCCAPPISSSSWRRDFVRLGDSVAPLHRGEDLGALGPSIRYSLRLHQTDRHRGCHLAGLISAETTEAGTGRGCREIRAPRQSARLRVDRRPPPPQRLAGWAWRLRPPAAAPPRQRHPRGRTRPAAGALRIEWRIPIRPRRATAAAYALTSSATPDGTSSRPRTGT